MRSNVPLNNDWQFAFACTDEFLRGEVPGEPVRLPHTAKLLPWNGWCWTGPPTIPKCS